MTSLIVPDKEQLQQWLDELGVDTYQCQDCAGLHLSEVEEQSGVINSRLFVEPFGLLLTTELELRTQAMLPLSADLGRLSMDYPLLKLFSDVVDEDVPILVAAAVLPTGAGINAAQLRQFLELAVPASVQLSAECLQRDYLFLTDDGAASARPRSSLH